MDKWKAEALLNGMDDATTMDAVIERAAGDL
jgi:hypothetical protein